MTVSEAAAAPTRPAWPLARRASLVVALLAAFGVLLAAGIDTALASAPPVTGDIYFRLFGGWEAGGSVPVLVVLVGVALCGVTTTAEPWRPSPLSAIDTHDRLAWWLGGIVFAMCALGVFTLPMRVGFSMDEFNADFQASILRTRHWSTTLPSLWSPVAGALTPIFVRWQPLTGAWASGYLPGYAAIRAVVWTMLGQPWLTNALLSACTLPVLAATTRAMRFSREERVLALLLLAVAPQFLAMGMTAYAMPAHLLANLAWLAASRRRDRVGVVGSLVVGAIAINLHNPFPHALFVAPFLLRGLRERRWGWVGAHAVVYLAAIAAAWSWFQYTGALSGTSGGTGLFAWPGREAIIRQLAAMVLLMSWNVPLLLPMFVTRVGRWTSMSTDERDLVAGVAATLVFYVFFNADQGHGWGYRYVHAVLGSMVLIGARAWPDWLAWLGERRARAALVVSAAVAVTMQLPWRAWELQHTVTPFAHAFSTIRGQDVDVVVVTTRGTWYASDLVRNTPRLDSRPVILAAERLNDDGRAYLRRLSDRGLRVQYLSPTDLDALGLQRDRRRGAAIPGGVRP